MEDYFEEKLEKLAAALAISRATGADVIAALDDACHSGYLLCASRWAAHFLAQPAVEDVIWEWLISKSENANLDYQISLSVGVYELLIDEIRWKKKLFGLLTNPKLWWIFVEVYEREPAEFYASLKEVTQARLERLS